jgi:hypothetical protein
MKPVEIVSLVTGILGALLGTAGFVISILAYLRDRPRLRVTLQWDMAIAGGNPDTKIGIVSVANVGRRPSYAVMASLVLPKGYHYTHEALMESIPGRQLVEGGTPATFTVNYDGLGQYKRDWRKIRVMVQDSAGKQYYSNYPKKKPSWAE